VINLNPETKTLICIGSGGVGKTTLAATIAIGKAYEGKKVLVLTIDPSLRLAQALGMKPDGNIHNLTTEEMRAKKGQLFACVIQHNKAFREFILKASGDKLATADIEKLTNNRLYKQLSTKLSGSQEFTSLFKLNDYVSRGEYDLVILDTPPAQHTWQFLKAPEKLSQLFNEGVASWFRNPNQNNIGFLKKVLNLGTGQVLKALETLTGADFIKELSMFFSAIQNWQGPLEQQVMDCHRLLTSMSTEFFLVTMLDPSRILESQKISYEIQQEGYHLTAVVINKVPSWFRSQNEQFSDKLQKLSRYYLDIENQLTALLLEKSGVGFKNNLKIYKCPEVSQNEIHDKNLSEVYLQIRQLR
jgi:anion-transporting  ArsA/GET3 family ATPase